MLPLQDQPFQILRLLIEAAPEVVTREQISSVLWPSDTFVDFDLAINTAVRKLRQALDDSPDQPRFIRTLAKRGYRFIEKVDWVDEPPAVPDKRTEERVVIRPGPPWRKSLLIKAGVVLVASVALVLVWWIAQHHPEPPLTAVPVTSLQGGAGWMSFSGRPANRLRLEQERRRLELLREDDWRTCTTVSGHSLSRTESHRLPADLVAGWEMDCIRKMEPRSRAETCRSRADSRADGWTRVDSLADQ